MGSRFKRSWDIAKKTFNVMLHDKEILLFPILSSIFSVILFLLLLFPFVLTFLTGKVKVDDPFVIYLAVFAFYFIAAFTATFFNAGIVHIAKTRFSGGDATFMDGIKAAWSKLGKIVAWSLLTATVGLILNILQNQAREKGGIVGFIGKILVSILGFAWAIVSVFVVPAIVIKGVGPIDALKSSVKAIKKTWGESLIRYYGLGLVRGIFTIVGILFFLVPGIYLIFQGTLGTAFVFIGIFILYIAIVSVIFTSANAIFNTALFMYAEDGKVPEFYSKEQMDHAFISNPKKKKLF